MLFSVQEWIVEVVHCVDFHNLLSALRLPFSAKHHVYEIDTDEVLNYKNTVLELVSKQVASNSSAQRHCIRVDFSKGASPWVEPLLEFGFKERTNSSF